MTIGWQRDLVVLIRPVTTGWQRDLVVLIGPGSIYSCPLRGQAGSTSMGRAVLKIMVEE